MPLVDDPNTVTNSFTSAFLLDRPKLTRILTILEDRFREAGLEFNPVFEVTHANGKQLKLTSVEDLFSLDNPVRNSIKELEITSVALKVSTDDGQYLSDEDRRIMQCRIKYDSSSMYNIYLSVKAQKSPKLSNQIFAELEEQIERTFLRSWVYKYVKGPLVSVIWSFVGLVGLVVGALYLIVPPDVDVSLNNRSPEVQMLLEKAKHANTTDEKVDFLFEYQAKQIELIAQPPNKSTNLSRLLTMRNLFILLPLLIIVGCIMYVVRNCYPRAGFLWGDYESHYNDLMSRKKAVWTVVIISLLVGIVGNLFVYGVSGYMK
jgi:hypothetical protein